MAGVRLSNFANFGRYKYRSIPSCVFHCLRYLSSLYTSTMTCGDIIKIIFAIILPPLGVFLEVGCSGAFFLNIILTILGYIPGIIHAVYIIVTR